MHASPLYARTLLGLYQLCLLRAIQHEQKVKIDKRDIAREAGVPYEDFIATISKMNILCGDLVCARVQPLPFITYTTSRPR